MPAPTPRPATASYYSSTIPHFLASSSAEVLGQLAGTSGHTAEATQLDAWKQQITLLQDALQGIDGSLFLEFDVPRLGSRVDGVVVAGSAVIPIEFKVGEKRYARGDYNQAWDYALDLKNFHGASSTAPIFPVLCATEAQAGASDWDTPHADGVYPPRTCNASTVREALTSALTLATSAATAAAPDATPDPIDADAWGRAPYRPSPTIIEAARSLYAQHSVVAISSNDAGRRNLQETSQCVEDIIDRARTNREKAIVFVTGVPGAGKTLVGLNVATQRRADDATHAVFLSGNGPLVAVLREALVEDELARQVASGAKPDRKGVVRQRVKPFIQNVHHFRDDGLRDMSQPPAEHVAIFDEAQRAWDQRQTANFMQRRKGIKGFGMSEPQFLLSYMDRHEDWAVVVCLVGGGQEIHTGEAGIGAWLDAVRTQFPHWRTYISNELHDAEYAAGQALQQLHGHDHVHSSSSLHLSVSMRSFRSEQVSGFVKAMLDSDVPNAQRLLQEVLARYPIVLTRDRNKAKHWLKTHARGSERYGLVASSQAQRLKAYCIDVRVNVDQVKYFLADRTDTRSSFYLEDAATEFQTQGLELDWACVGWDADLRRHGNRWAHHSFRGAKWVHVRNDDRQRYLLNAYRVLLTRARQGMVLFVPRGRSTDHTIRPEYYDETYAYLTSLGIPELER